MIQVSMQIVSALIHETARRLKRFLHLTATSGTEFHLNEFIFICGSEYKIIVNITEHSSALNIEYL